MFGYVKPDSYNLYVKDVALYKALYCSLCKSIGASCNQIARFTVSFDVTFLSALLHNTEGIDISVRKEHCAVHPITKRPIAKVDALTKLLGSLNVLLSYYKLNDDVLDEKKGGVRRLLLSRAYQKAKRQFPRLAEVIRQEYARLSEFEKKKESSVLVVADPFGEMLRRICAALPLSSPSEGLNDLCYAVGEWIYLIDALDDFDKDKKKKAYNAFFYAYPDATDAASLRKQHGEELHNLFGSLQFSIQEAYRTLRFGFNHDLLDNVVYRGIPKKTEEILKKGANNE